MKNCQKKMKFAWREVEWYDTMGGLAQVLYQWLSL